MIHVYYGNGKGKTTAATGLAVRAAGTGMRVYVVRFMKTDNSGEVKSLQQINNITVEPVVKSFGFTFNMTEEQKKEAKIFYTEMLRKAIAKENVENYDMIVMDEANIVYGYEFIEKEELINFLVLTEEYDANKLEIDLDPAKIREDYKKDYDNIYGDDSLNRVQKSLALKELLHMSICQVVNDLDLFFTRPFDLTPEEHAEKNKQEQKALEQELQMS